MSKHLALVGAGHSHLAVLRAGAEFIAAGRSVTLITPSDYFYYSGMGPGLLSGRYSPQQVRFHVKKMAEARGIDVVIDSVVRLHPPQNALQRFVKEYQVSGERQERDEWTWQQSSR